MKFMLYYLGLSASATLGFLLAALFRGGDPMEDNYGIPCKWLADNEVCVNADCPVCADWCPCGEYAPVICRHYAKGEDAHADR